jgi:hypothetical protein
MDSDDAYVLALEARLQIAAGIMRGCECAGYLTRRQDVLLPAIAKQADATGEDPDYVLARFMRGVHARHAEGTPA